MSGSPWSTPTRRWAAIGVAALALFLAFSFRSVPPSGEVAILDSPILKATARILPPGWHFVPAGVRAVYRYPEESRRLDLILDGRHGFRLEAKDGGVAGVDMEIEYAIRPEKVLEVHRLYGPAYEETWLTPEVVDAARDILARNTFDEVARGNRGRLERALAAQLARALGEAGLTLEAVRVWRVEEGNLAPNLDRADLSADRDARVLFVGLDGADWTLIDPLIAAGKMPNLERLVRSGVRARLRTISPVLSPVIWTTVATGKMPSKHGIVDFLAVDSRTGERVPVTSNLRRTKAIWNILSDQAVSVGMVAWWATWPAEPVDGFVVTERVAYQLFGMGEQVAASDEGKVYPASLYPEVEQMRVRPADVPLTEVQRFLNLPGGSIGALPEPDRERVEEFRTVLAGTASYHAIARRLFRERPTAFRAVYFEGIDTTSHLFMQFRPPRLPVVTEEQVAAFGDAVDRFHVYQDQILGELLDEFGGDEVNVIIASDHGFRSGTNRPLEDARIGGGKAAEWHRKYGVLLLSGPAFRDGIEVEEASVADITPTILQVYGLPLASDMDGIVLREAFEPEYLESHPPQSIRTYDDPEGAPEEDSGEQPITSEADAAIVQKLTALGYISQAGSNSRNNQGVLLLNQGRFAEAIEEFRAALETDPDFLVARINMGRAYMLMNNGDEALAVFEDVLVRDPEAQEVENFVGNIYMERQEYEKAEAHFQRAVEIEPNNADAHNSLGILYERLERFENSMAEYRQVIAIDPDYGEGYNNLGNVLKKVGRLQEAAEMYRRAMEADPGFVGSFNNMALLLQEQGDIAGAIEYYRQAVEKAPDHPQVRLNLGSLYYAQGNFEEARDEFLRAIELDPGYAEAHNNLGAVYGQMKEYDKELEELRKAVALNPDYADARHNLGLAYLRGGQEERGIDQLRRAVVLRPDYLSARITLGATLERRGRHADAIPHLEAALRMNPNLAVARNHLASAYLGVGRRQEAIEQLRASLAIAPNQPQIRQRLAELE